MLIIGAGSTGATIVNEIRYYMVICSMNGKGVTKFAAVRFGNVLGSRSSVVPYFLKQIAQGKDITVVAALKQVDAKKLNRELSILENIDDTSKIIIILSNLMPTYWSSLEKQVLMLKDNMGQSAAGIST